MAQNNISWRANCVMPCRKQALSSASQLCPRVERRHTKLAAIATDDVICGDRLMFSHHSSHHATITRLPLLSAVYPPHLFQPSFPIFPLPSLSLSLALLKPHSNHVTPSMLYPRPSSPLHPLFLFPLRIYPPHPHLSSSTSPKTPPLLPSNCRPRLFSALPSNPFHRSLPNLLLPRR